MCRPHSPRYHDRGWENEESPNCEKWALFLIDLEALSPHEVAGFQPVESEILQFDDPSPKEFRQLGKLPVCQWKIDVYRDVVAGMRKRIVFFRDLPAAELTGHTDVFVVEEFDLEVAHFERTLCNGRLGRDE